MALIGALLSACTSETGVSEESTTVATIVIEDNHGQIEVPVNPQRVVALDNTVFQTLSDWGIPLVAAPKGVMGNLCRSTPTTRMSSTSVTTVSPTLR